MFSKVFAAAAVAVVSAADVPVFSSNDDYDEINLNIRMLSNVTTGAPHTGSAQVSGSSSQSQTGANTCGTDTTIKTAHETTLRNTIKTYMNADSGTATAACARRLSEGRQLTYVDANTPYTQVYAYTMTFPSAAACAAAVAAFSPAAIKSLVEDAFVACATCGITAVTATIGTPTPVTTPGPAAAAPSPSPSSNAAKVAVSTLAAFSAFVASMM